MFIRTVEIVCENWDTTDISTAKTKPGFLMLKSLFSAERASWASRNEVCYINHQVTHTTHSTKIIFIINIVLPRSWWKIAVQERSLLFNVLNTMDRPHRQKYNFANNLESIETV